MTEDEARKRFERFVRWTIEEEWPAHEQFLPEGEREAYASYYRNLPKRGDEPAIRRYLRGFWRGDAGWTARWLAARSRPRVMDAGSGFGTYSMLYAAMGADVVGADLRPDRLAAAERRAAFYRARTGLALDVRYARADLTRDWERDVDLVWVYNALSHIDPLDAFLGAVRDHLRPGGVLVVGDINGAHPEHLRRLAKLRDEVHQEYVAPDGQRHAYAVERTFAPREMRSVMEANGLRVVHHELYWGGLGAAPDLLYHAALEPLQRAWWTGHGTARRQLVVAARA
ncbi:MAG TPA: class I SAM-dependent methyltransferase [Candidatus Saccharimonadaceae bacterium]|jgi:SAM-dependent methyltransferase|nr:class I SAM-dependent methyltransferase [Candidatus Saccharimonadaceae bacterium]